MLDPITTTPDDLMDAPVHSIADRAADCIDRLRRLIALPPSTATDEIIDRERDLIRVRSVAVRVRAASVATYLRAAYGAGDGEVHVATSSGGTFAGLLRSRGGAGASRG